VWLQQRPSKVREPATQGKDVRLADGLQMLCGAVCS
jgi:hypothetical protein